MPFFLVVGWSGKGSAAAYVSASLCVCVCVRVRDSESHFSLAKAQLRLAERQRTPQQTRKKEASIPLHSSLLSFVVFGCSRDVVLGLYLFLRAGEGIRKNIG